ALRAGDFRIAQRLDFFPMNTQAESSRPVFMRAMKVTQPRVGAGVSLVGGAGTSRSTKLGCVKVRATGREPMTNVPGECDTSQTLTVPIPLRDGVFVWDNSEQAKRRAVSQFVLFQGSVKLFSRSERQQMRNDQSTAGPRSLRHGYVPVQ